MQLERNPELNCFLVVLRRCSQAELPPRPKQHEVLPKSPRG